MTITTGKYAGQTGTIEANVYQGTTDYPDEWANGYHVMLDTEELVTIRWDQVMGIEPATCCLRNSCSATELHRPGHRAKSDCRSNDFSIWPCL